MNLWFFGSTCSQVLVNYYITVDTGQDTILPITHQRLSMLLFINPVLTTSMVSYGVLMATLVASPASALKINDIRDAAQSGQKLLWITAYARSMSSTTHALFGLNSFHLFEPGQNYDKPRVLAKDGYYGGNWSMLMEDVFNCDFSKFT